MKVYDIDSEDADGDEKEKKEVIFIADKTIFYFFIRILTGPLLHPKLLMQNLKDVRL